MRTIVLGLMLAGALMLNVATIAIGSVASAVSAVFEAVTGMVSVKTRLEDEVKSTKADVEAKGRQVKALEGELDAKGKQVVKLEGDLKSAAADIEVKTKQVQKLQGEVDLLKPREVTYRGEKKPLGAVVEETSERVARRTALGASRNVAATFGEAIPVLGIGVVVAATVWETKDSCDTMKDLHDLDVAMDPTKATAAGVSEVCGLKVPSKEEILAKVKASPGEAWAMAKAAIPDLPDMPTFSPPELPAVNWTFWD